MPAYVWSVLPMSDSKYKHMWPFWKGSEPNTGLKDCLGTRGLHSAMSPHSHWLRLNREVWMAVLGLFREQKYELKSKMWTSQWPHLFLFLFGG